MSVDSWHQDGDISIDRKFELAVPMGQVPGCGFIAKFGENPEIDTATTPADIWEGGAVGHATPLYVWNTGSTIDSVSSSSASDVGRLIRIVGILQPSADSTEQVGWAVTNGQTRVAIYDNPSLTGSPISYWRVYRMSNESVTGNDVIGTVYCYENTALTAGKPTDLTKIKAMIRDGNNQTLMAIYTVPPKKVAFFYHGEIGASRALASGQVQCAYYSRRFGKCFQIKKRVDLSASASSLYQDERSFPDPIPALTDIRLTVENVSANDTGVFGAFDLLLVDESKFSPTYLASIAQPGY